MKAMTLLGFPGRSVVKNPRANAGDVEDSLEQEMATWEILWTEEPGRLQSRGLQESDMT